jgi:hypothetical protein
MAIYTVHLQGEGKAALTDARFVREGFSWGGFLLGPIWLFWHRLWIAAGAWILTVALGSLFLVNRLQTPAIFVIFLLIEILVGLEGNHLRRIKLDRTRFRLADVVAATGLEEAEFLFFRHWDAADEDMPQPRPAGSAPLSGERQVLGIFPEPEQPR